MNSEQGGGGEVQGGMGSAAGLEERLQEGRRLFAEGRYGESAAVLQALVGDAPGNAAAWLELGRLALTIPDLPAARDFLNEAVAHDPGNIGALSLLGEVLRRDGAWLEAQAYLQRALAVAPDDLLLACRLANCYVGSGELFKANELLSGLLARYPSVGELYLLRGLVLYQLRHDAQAEADLHLCLGLAPNSAQALAALGDIYRDRELYEEAADFVDRAYQLAPDDIHVARARAYLSLALRDWGKAADILAEVLQQAPSDVVAAVNRVAALIESGNALAAIDALEDALRVGASEPWVHEMLGAMFAQRGDWKIAVENLEASVAREPTSTTGWNILIVAYSKLGEMEKAEAAAKKILEIDPHHVNALINLGGLKIDLGFHDEGIQLFQRALAQAPESPAAYSGLLFGMLFSSEVPVKDILEAAANGDERVWHPLLRNYSFADRNQDVERSLKIGWVSSDLRGHAVGAFVGPFVGFLNKERFQHYVYDNWSIEDSVTAMIRPFATHWRKILGLGDNAAAELIRSDEIDILIDLNGYTAGHRLGVFARKPAPIQVEWLGYPGTTGMSAMDYILVPNDDFLAKGGWCTEMPWPLKDCYGVRSGIPDVPVRETLPCDESNIFTFACMNRFSKVSMRALDLWGDLLLKVPNSRLLLIGRGGSDEQTVRALRKRFQEKGVPAERLEILESKPPHEYLDTYNQVDLCLDPFPFNGGTTGFDSIWMGVPYVTLRGDSLHSRAGSNILKYVDLADLVADSESEYVAKAVALAADRDALRRHRNRLRERMMASPLMDTAGFAKGIEDALRGMWRVWCEEGGEK